MNTNNNPLAEISLLVISALLIIGGVVLMYFGKIDFTALTLILGIVGALHGVNGALKAPSASQQIQLGVLQENLQQILTQVLSALPDLLQVQQPTQPPAQQSQKALQMLGSPNDYHTGSNMVTLIPPSAQVPQQPFPPAQPSQFPTVRNPQSIPAVNLADTPPAQQDNSTRHFGDTGIVPSIGQ